MKETIPYTKVLSSNSSFQLVRTNPKLTGNLKITVDENDKMWLDAIAANSELAKDDYVKVPIDTSVSLVANVYRFFKNGQTPGELVFSLTERADSTKTSKDFKDQYDFANYFSGIRYFPSPKYDQRLAYFAPLYLKKEVPNYFIILKIKDPLNAPVNISKQNFESGQSRTDFLIDLFKKASLIKTFDLRPTTSVGKYIRDYVNANNFPISPLTVSFEENGFTTWNGMLFDVGAMGGRGELLYDQYRQSTPLKFFEENITKGFERNNVIFPNILNFEFIFNDETSTDYELNRYLGLYVNAIELSELDIDLERMYAEKKTWPNTPRLRRPYLESDETTLPQSNPDGVILPYKNLEFNISEFEEIFSNSESLYFNYLSDKFGKFYLPKLQQPYTINRSSSITVDISLPGSISEVFYSGSVGSGVVAGTYYVSPSSTSGSGQSGSFKITLDPLYGISQVVILSGGKGYAVGDTITFDGIAFGGASVIDDLVLTVSAISQIVDVESEIAHGYSTGDCVLIEDSTISNFDGQFYITVTSPLTFTYEISSILSAPTNGSATCKIDIGVGKIRLSNTDVDAARFFGPSDALFLQDKGFGSNSSGFTYNVIKVNGNLSHLDEIKIYYPNGTRADANGKYDLITLAVNYPLVAPPGSFYVNNDYDNIIGYDTFYANTVGLKNEITSAIANCINNFRNRSFTAYAYDDHLFIVCTSPGDFDLIHRLSFSSPSNEYTTVEVDGVTGAELIGTIFNFKGGSRPSGNRLVIDKGHFDKINQEIDNLLIRTTKNWSKIKKISGYIDLVNEENQILASDVANVIAEYNSKMVIVLEDAEAPAIAYGDFIARKKFRPEFGIFSLFPIKDFDFDFYSSTYLNYPEIDFYQNYFIPADIDLIRAEEQYSVANDAIIKFNHPDLTATSTTSINLSVLPSPILLDIGTTAVNNLINNNVPAIIVQADDENYLISNIASIFSPGVIQLASPPLAVSGTGTYSSWNVYAAALQEGSGYSNFRLIVNTSYSNFLGNALVTYGSNSASSNPLTAYTKVRPIYDENNELIDFPGFSILKDPTKIVPENTTTEYSIRTKYINGLTATEYDYYKENDGSDFALRSKIIPYITKWAIKNGLDARDNPYRLNTELVFGRNNFSPDHTDGTQNPNNFTHEWFYVESKFNYVDSLETSSRNNYYFDVPFDVSRLISEEDYFIDYFTYTPAFGNETNGLPLDVAPTQFRYSDLFKNIAKQYETFFKGFKILFKDVTDPTVIGADGKPVAKADTTRFSDYRFSCILKPIKEEFFNLSQPPVRYRIIENTNSKSIIVYIEIALGHFDLNSDYWYGTSARALPRYKRLTSINNTSAYDYIFYAEPDINIIDPGYPFETIYGDYRIKFDQVEGMNISNINYNLLYALKNKKFNIDLDNFSNVKISSQLSISVAGANGVDYFSPPPIAGAIAKRNVPSISKYPSKLSDEVTILPDLTLIGMKNNLNGQFFMIDTITGSTPSPNPIVSAADGFLTFNTDPDYPGLVTPTTISPYLSVYDPVLPVASGLTTLIRQYFSFFVIGGGSQYLERLFQKISFAKFKDFVNRLDPLIEYESYTDGVKNQNPNFYIEIADVSQVSKVNQIITNSTISPPSQFSSRQIVDYQYEQAPLYNSVELNRYKGEYEPVMKDLLFCRSNFKFIANPINDLKLSNTRINPEIADLLTVKNFGHIKVADTKILDLEADEAYLPVYPAVDEVAIGRADYFLLNSNWDWGFHHKYSDKSSFSPVAGSLRIEEDDCFLAKVIALPSGVDLNDFQTRVLLPTEKLEDVDLTQVELVYKENDETLDGYFNLNNALTSYFISDGIEQKFNEYLPNLTEFIGNFTSVQEYVKEYIRLNILNLYELDAAQFFYKRNATLFSSTKVKNSNLIVFDFLNDTQRSDRGYSELRGVQINKTDRLIIRFSIQKELAAGFNVSPRIKIKFI